MDCFQNKKSAVSGFLVMVLIITAGFVIIFIVVPLIVGGADTEASDSICRGSVALKARTYTEVDAPVIPVKLFDVSTPLLCKTSHLKLPEDRNADKEDVKKLFADLMASCWNRYGEGLIKDVFKGQGGIAKNNCQICYTIDLRETSKFDGEYYPHPDDCDVPEPPEPPEPPICPDGYEEDYYNKEYENRGGILFREFGQYLFDTPYKVISEDDRCKVDGGFCIEKPTLDNTEEEVKRDCVTSGDVERINLAASSKYLEIDTTSSVCKNKGLKTCCYSKYECLSKGGICKTDANRPDANEYTEYNEWKCPPEPSGLNCYIKEENYYSYGDYIQSFGGEGIVMISANIIPGETYAISFGSPTETCGWCGTLIKIGAITGGIAGIAIGVALAPASFGTSLTAAVAGAGLITGATGAAYLAQVTAAGIENLREKFGSRNFPTVYLTTLNQITEGEELCKRIESL